MLGAIIVVCGATGLVAGKLISNKPKVVASTVTPVIQNKVTNSVAPTNSITQPLPVAHELQPIPQPSEPIENSAATPSPTDVGKESPSIPVREKAVRYGKSEQGRPLTAYVLGDGPDVTMIFGAFHGNEPITDDVVLKLRNYLKDNPKYLQGRRVILAPVVNPDGLRLGKRSNANGVDLNRNFPGTWRKQATKARYNPGPSAASESETQAVIKLMDDYQPTKVVSIHQPFHTMNYTGKAGQRLAEAMQKKNRYPVTGDIGYPTPGSFGDYCGKTRGVAIVTHELPDQSASAAWSANRDAWLAAIAH